MIDIDIVVQSDNGQAADLVVSGHRVSGIKALAQRVLIVLLTSSSGMLRSQEGTRLPDSYGNSHLVPEYYTLLMGSAIASTMSIIKNDTTSNDPTEILSDIRLLDVKTTEDSMSFTIAVYNRAGEQITVTSSGA